MALPLLAGKEIAMNMAMSVPAVRDWRLRRPRAGTDFSGGDADLKRYAFQALDEVTRLLGAVEGKSVIEIGAGDLLTSGMALFAAGASSYTSVDRFVGDYSRPAGKHWYREIRSAWPRLYPDLPWPSWLSAEEFPEAYNERVKVIAAPIEDANGDVASADIVCSFQVGEHVSDIDAFTRATSSLTKPDGIAIHRIDLGPHGPWQECDDPLTFLRLPDPVWKMMGSARGTPNRRRAHEIIESFKLAGLAVDVYSKEYFPEDSVDFRRLPQRFRRMPRESLLTRTICLTARHRQLKP